LYGPRDFESVGLGARSLFSPSLEGRNALDFRRMFMLCSTRLFDMVDIEQLPHRAARPGGRFSSEK